MLYVRIAFLLMVSLLVGCKESIPESVKLEQRKFFDRMNRERLTKTVNEKLPKLELHSTVDNIIVGTIFAKHFNADVTYIATTLLVTEETTREEILADTLAILKACQPLAKQDRKLAGVGTIFLIPSFGEDGNIERDKDGSAIGWSMLNMVFDQTALWKTNFTKFNPARLEKLAIVYEDDIDELLEWFAEEREWLAEEREE